MTREEVYAAYVENADETGRKGWYFLPYDCICRCGFDFYEKYGEKLTKMYPTGCPKCNKSYCE